MYAKLLKKIIFMSKYATLGVVVQCLLFTVILAEDGKTQPVSLENVYVSFKLNNTSIEEAFAKIESSTNFSFAYKKKIIKQAKRQFLKSDFSNESVAGVLRFISDNTGLSFKRVDETIHVVNEETTVVQGIVELADVDISGKITDENGEGLPGASVLIKGTRNGTTTNLEGEYKLSAPEDGTLTISFVGYITQEIAIGTQSTIDSQMELDAAQLDEIVVVGYGTQKKSDLTGSVVSMNPDKNADMRNHNVLQSLKGSVAGISIGTPDRPGEAPSLQVRGRNSLIPNSSGSSNYSNSNNPLVVLDGIIYYGSLNNLNVGDIESVDILKDASAAAVYGSRSSNGVIIVTTKKGKAGKPVFNFNASYGVSDDVVKIPVLGPEGYIQKVLDERIARGETADASQISTYLTITERDNLAAGKTRDWYDELINSSSTENYSLSVAGSNENTDYFISGSYLGTEGIVKNDNFERITARVNLSNQITDWFNLSVKSSFSNLDYSGDDAPYRWGLSPYASFYQGGEDSGTLDDLEQFPMEDTFFQHPFIDLLTDDHDVRTDLWGVISSQIDIPFIEGLKWTTNYSLNSRRRNEYRFTGNRNKDAATSNGIGYKRVHDNYSWTFDNILNYNNTFNDVHSISATFLLSREYQRVEFIEARASQFFNQNLGFNSLEVGGTPSVNTNFEDQNQQAVMGRLNYIFDDKYSVTGTVRRDGYSAFAEGNKYATFLSGAVAWTLSNEAFLQDVSWIDRLKLRLSYGENGNQAIGRYATLARMSRRNTVFGDGGGTTTGVFVNSVANGELGWETTKVTNLGIEFGILDNAIRGTIDIYNSNTTDLLVNRGLPAHFGIASVATNLGKVNNKGVEISLKATPIKSEEFAWNVGVVFDRTRNKIVELFGDDNDGDGVEDDVLSNNWFIGEPLGVFYGYDINGIHQTGESDIPTGYQPGDFRIVDHDGDGELTADDRHILGYDIPSYSFSISNSLEYKNWSFNVMVNSIQGGGKYYKGDNISLYNANQSFDGWSQRFNFPQMDYWTPDNPSNTAASIKYVANRRHPVLEDRSFVRIQDVMLSYSFDSSIIEKLKVNSLRLYASIKNLHTFTSWNGFDPENNTTINRGLPLMRTVTFGVDLSF